MQYFVAIENTYYHRWQAELLIESFKMAGLQDDLLIGLVHNDRPQQDSYRRNLDSHKTAFSIEPFKHEGINVPQCNTVYSLVAAVKQKLVSQPFAFLRPHMLLQRRLKPQEENIVFNQEYPAYTEILAEKTQALAQEREVTYPDAIPVGETIIFNDVGDDFFDRLLMRTLALVGDVEFPGNATQAASMLTLYDYAPLYSFRHDRLEATFNDHQLANIISYRDGLPPLFHKRQFVSEVLQMGSDPCEVLMEFNPTVTTDFMQKVVRSYKGEE